MGRCKIWLYAGKLAMNRPSQLRGTLIFENWVVRVAATTRSGGVTPQFQTTGCDEVAYGGNW